MLKKLLYIIIPLFLVLLGWFGLMLKEKYFPPPSVHYHAGFIVVKDGKIVDFSGNEYMNARACGSMEHKHLTPEEEQLEKAHLHDHVGDVVHVHVNGALWKDLFKNIDYPFDENTVTVYNNKERITDFKNFPIMPYQSLVIFVGKPTNEKKFLDQTVTKKHIEEIEKKSESCAATNK
ncbi:hypothetical protein HY310_01900 [Candidatus Microgenomates bacterium]|nr:hypothetical protein [Candidatus Microgenomates bacterium]